MTSRHEQLESLAALFTYPQPGYLSTVENAVACCGLTASTLLEFAVAIRRMSLADLQELYTSTFDLQPLCALELGWHLFGEDYNRGVFLARMRRELHAHRLPETHELPDHLSHALRLLAHMRPAPAEEFACAIVAPAVERILKCMPSDNVLFHLPLAARQLVSFHFPAAFEPAAPVAEGVML
jgi:nitrate reductase molybdenum cofactor assembly chaperone NarJ/NarW